MVTDLEQLQRLQNRFTDDFSWSGTLQFHDSQTVSVLAKGGMAGSIHMRRIIPELRWKILRADGDVRFDRCIVDSLQGAPSQIGRDLDILDCHNLTTLGGTFNTVGRDFSLKALDIKSLVGGPKFVGRNVSFKQLHKLESLEGFPTSVGGLVELDYNPHMGLLRTLVAKKVWLLGDEFQDKGRAVERILNKYAGQGKRALFDCQKDLEDAGFPENARW